MHECKTSLLSLKPGNILCVYQYFFTFNVLPLPTKKPLIAYSDTLPPVLVYAGQESRGFLIRDCKRGGRLSGRGVRTIWRHPCCGSRVLKFGVGFNLLINLVTTGT